VVVDAPDSLPRKIVPKGWMGAENKLLWVQIVPKPSLMFPLLIKLPRLDTIRQCLLMLLSRSRSAQSKRTTLRSRSSSRRLLSSMRLYDSGEGSIRRSSHRSGTMLDISLWSPFEGHREQRGTDIC
jgi:hypothetical protein